MDENTNTLTNGVPTPAGLTDEQFLELVEAKRDVAQQLADPNVLPTLETETDAYFGSLQPYYVREFARQARTGSTIATRIGTYLKDSGHTLESVTPAQDAAAAESLGNAANVAVGTSALGSATGEANTLVGALKSPTTAVVPQIVSVQPPVSAVPFPPSGPAIHAAPAIVTVKTSEGFFQHEAENIHDAIVKALHWIESL